MGLGFREHHSCQVALIRTTCTHIDIWTLCVGTTRFSRVQDNHNRSQQTVEKHSSPSNAVFSLVKPLHNNILMSEKQHPYVCLTWFLGISTLWGKWTIIPSLTLLPLSINLSLHFAIRILLIYFPFLGFQLGEGNPAYLQWISETVPEKWTKRLTFTLPSLIIIVR